MGLANFTSLPCGNVNVNKLKKFLKTDLVVEDIRIIFRFIIFQQQLAVGYSV